VLTALHLLLIACCVCACCFDSNLLQESINLWWINDALTALNLSFIPNVPCPPVSEAVFNFVLGWCLMFLPVMLTDGPSQKVEKKVR
jgi:hypothetical protein